MSISFVHLRRILFGTSCAIVFGFGASQALAAPVQAAKGGGCFYYQVQECNNYCSFNYGLQGRCTSSVDSYDCACYRALDQP